MIFLFNMLNEAEFIKIYNEFVKMELHFTDKFLAWHTANPNIDKETYLKQSEWIEKIIYLKNSFHKLYHWHLMLGITQGEFYAERKRIVDENGKEIYRLKQKIEALEKENNKLKQNINQNI